jgi:hypothetical protein
LLGTNNLAYFALPISGIYTGYKTAHTFATDFEKIKDFHRDKLSLWNFSIEMRLCHPPDGSTSPKYKLLGFKLP